MSKIFVEGPHERLARYDAAASRIANWETLLDEAFEFTIPNKNGFSDTTRGEERGQQVFDGTPTVGVQTFASNIQSILMPPFKHWAVFQSGPEIAEEEKLEKDKMLQKISSVMFRWIDKSNFNLVVNESLQELAIGTGVMLVNEGDDENPLEFTSVPISSVAVEEGAMGKLENFWRLFKIPVRSIMIMWPKAKLTPALKSMMDNSPDAEVELIEGTIRYRGNPKDKQYYYYVQLKSSSEDILTEFRSFSPWVGFRFSKAPGEILGRGPVITALPFIRSLNKAMEFELMSASINAYPMYIASSTGIINPNNLVLQPGAIIPVEPNFITNPPIQPLPSGGDVRFLQLSVQELRQQISDIMFTNPIGPADGPNKTATEVSIRQQEWIRRSGASFGRLTVELLDPIINKVFRILKKRGLIVIDGEPVDIEIDDKFTSIRYESPIIDLQAEDDVLRYERWAQLLTAQFGPNGLLGVNVEKVPIWLAEKLRVDLDLAKDSDNASDAIAEFQKTLTQSQSEPGDIQPGTLPVQPFGGQPSVPSIGL